MSQEPAKTGMFCDDRNTMDAIIEFAVQNGFMSRCNHDGESVFHYSDKFTSVDEVVMLAREEGLIIFYEDNGTCYKLTSKGEDWYALQSQQTVSRVTNN